MKRYFIFCFLLFSLFSFLIVPKEQVNYFINKKPSVVEYTLFFNDTYKGVKKIEVSPITWEEYIEDVPKEVLERNADAAISAYFDYLDKPHYVYKKDQLMYYTKVRYDLIFRNICIMGLLLSVFYVSILLWQDKKKIK